MSTKTIQEAIASKIAGSGENVQNIVVEQMATVEINRRVELITKCIKKSEELEKELKKLDKNDFVTYVGGEKQEVMSKELFEKIKKHKEKMQKLDAATDKALNDNTFDSYLKLTETLNKLNNGGGSKEESES